MSRMRSERGASLVLVIGIVAALAIMASSLVILVVNAQSNTLRDRNRAKSFNVAEAALDQVMYNLSIPGAWPTAAQPAFSTSDFRNTFSAADFPNPKTGSFVSLAYFDNADTNNDGQITRADGIPYDKNGDGLLYVEAQSGVGNSATRIQAELQKVNLNPLLRRNVAINTPGTLTINNSKPDVATTGDPAVAEIGGGIYSTSGLLPTSQWGVALDTGISGQTGSGTPTADSIIPPDVLALLKDSATHRYNGQPSASLGNSAWEGITYINSTTVVDLPSGTLNGNGTTALPKLPGILIVEGGAGIQVNGGGDFYGMVYTDGPFTNAGSYQIHGMLVAKGNVVLKGDQEVIFDPGVLYALDRLATLHVRVVGGTWREVRPL